MRLSAPSPNQYWSRNPQNPSHVKDPNYDAMYDAWQEADTIEEAQRWMKEANMYVEERHWSLWGGELHSGT